MTTLDNQINRENQSSSDIDLSQVRITVPDVSRHFRWRRALGVSFGMAGGGVFLTQCVMPQVLSLSFQNVSTVVRLPGVITYYNLDGDVGEEEGFLVTQDHEAMLRHKPFCSIVWRLEDGKSSQIGQELPSLIQQVCQVGSGENARLFASGTSIERPVRVQDEFEDKSAVFELQNNEWVSVGEFDGAVRTLIEYQGSLIVAGAFAHVDDEPYSSIVRYDHAWTPMGQGFQPHYVSMGKAYALEHSGTPTGHVSGYKVDIHALEVWNDQLVVAGRFYGVDDIASSNIVAWDGAEWHGFSTGVFRNYIFPGTNKFQATGGVITSLSSSEGQLIIGGEFYYKGSPTEPETVIVPVLRWNGSEWEELQALNHFVSPFERCTGIEVVNGTVYVMAEKSPAFGYNGHALYAFDPIKGWRYAHMWYDHNWDREIYSMQKSTGNDAAFYFVHATKISEGSVELKRYVDK